jgi:hypothetical protein
LKPYDKAVAKLSEALLTGGYFWPPQYRPYAMEQLWIAATKSDSSKLMLGAGNMIVTADASPNPKEREGSDACDDFREGFEFVLGVMASLGLDPSLIEDRRCWLRYFVNDLKALLPSIRLKAAESFILKFSSHPSWMTCIGLIPTLWIRAASGGLPDHGKSNNNNNNNNNDKRRNNNNNSNNGNNNMNKNTNKNKRRRERRKRGGGGGRSPSRSRSRSASPPAKKATPKQSPAQGASDKHPNRIAGICDSRTHKRRCSAEEAGRPCSLDHECPRCPGKTHSMLKCPLA